MLWPILAFSTAFFESLKDLFSKKNLKNLDEYTVALAFRCSFVFLLPFLFFTKIPNLGNKFLPSLLLSVILNIITTILYMKALKYSDISKSVPLLTFTPLFLLITSPLLVGEFPTFLGLIGIILIVFGSYILNFKKRNENYLTPFKLLLSETGPRYMLIVAFLWSISSNIDKIGVLNSSPLFWTISTTSFLAAFFLPIVLLRKKHSAKVVVKNLHFLIPISLVSALGLISQMTAISLTLVTYVVSIKRSSVVFSVLWGYLFFKEKELKTRMASAIIMTIGVLFITLS